MSAEPGEVTLQITNIEGRPAFQFISEPYLGKIVHAESLIGAPGDAVERAIATLRDLAVGRSPYSAGTARRWMEEVGTGLWLQMVPDAIKEEYWQLRDQITTFTIAADDNIPWELLYPLAPGRDQGFLVEGFPVLRRARGQGRARRLRLEDAHFVVSARQPKDAASEIAAVQAVIGSGETTDKLEDVLQIVDAGGPSVAHFACHNAFQADGAGSSIDLVGGPFVPEMLNRATARRSLARHNPIVFLNACRSAGAIPEYTQMMGWAQQFLSAGAGAFLGTLWAVRSDKASSFATTFYTALADGQPLGQAVLTARRSAASGDGDPTWLAYTAYGDPAATAHPSVTGSGETSRFSWFERLL
ncbi:CHAT domain-containing protein [Kitasatospora azatica]|uniref:CHAT domain-containing protein n=1 Tax=Kitasatospora azatica TaxID=58347 RepID=UPI0018DC25FA|nr:CHAT domain-containing protein [Kitasatospora azatica]